MHRRLVVSVPLVACLLASCSADRPRRDSAGLTPTAIDTLSRELIARADRAQAFRTRDYAALPESARAPAMAEWRAADSGNSAWLAELVARVGWPDQTRFGEQAAFAALLLLQYADRDLALQRKLLPLLEDAAARGEASRRNVAFLTDRLRVREGRPQVYGTQYEIERDAAGNVSYILPLVEDIDALDARRQDAGLGPWADYEHEMAERHRRDPASRPRAAGAVNSGP